MGKNLRQQRRGKGTPTYRSPSHRYIGAVAHENLQKGIVKEILHAPGRNTPVAVISSESREFLAIAREGDAAGSEYEILALGNLPEGTKVFNIEINPGDGGRMCRSAGSAATILSHEGNRTTLLMPSKKKKSVSSECRAITGMPSNTGRGDKPFMKAGNLHHRMRALGKLYPRTSG